MPFPTVPDKHRYLSAYRPAAFLEALRTGGWEPGPVPESVVFTYARFELYLAAHPEAYTPNHLLGPGPGRFFLVNATDGQVGVNCLGIGAPAADDAGTAFRIDYRRAAEVLRELFAATIGWLAR